MSKSNFFNTLFLFFYRILFRKHRGLNKNVSNNNGITQLKYQKYSSLALRSDLSSQTLVFNVEGALLKSSSLFPYFMLVAFEAGSFLRALALFLLYPFICLVSEEMGLKIMVMVCFFGIKKESFGVGKSVLPKFFLEDVGLEIFDEVLKRGGKRVGVSKFPQVMIESFLRDYLEIDVVIGRELKVFYGYFVGIMEEEKRDHVIALDEIHLGNDKMNCDHMIGITGFNKFLDHQLFSHCKEIYWVGEADKRRWQNLPRDKYPKPLIFHDGRLSLRPTPIDTLAIFMWLPFGFILAIFRAIINISLPTNISLPLASFTGMHLTVTIPKSTSDHHLLSNKPKNLIYVSNHRTLLDPLYLSVALKKSLIGLTYSLSRLSEIIAPIKTFRLTRNRDQDARMIKRLLNQGDLVICAEGTTCREPYLMRFSPLFAELSDEIIPVAIDSHVTMFHGTTASGHKCLDPLFYLMNPEPTYTVRFLEKVCGSSTCCDGEKSKFDVANHVQSEIGKALGFECTKLTRRDKYLILAGNEGNVRS